ncbi:MAG TPA: ribosome maturation factor RimP [Dictyoglomaceae bacterium]|nr:ribosome maturation factor RimP [Dictyoglomaceae bacterium]HOL39803.1 ribosome maturation factor RimP [Dictyoglomaceae bacterium]HOP95316.1 ribosome maturation factor RimP [Dictyoglomaceae bacterium]HPP16218.1 ribosome maturation factor RimP [Dictyoglomaceae bacterium]HPU42944.1 ribosome maturation factor RimP [Dictyoglomaceae bacterium]
MREQIHMEIIRKLREIIEPICENNSFEFVDLEYQRETHGWVLRVYIDKPGGITVEDCAHISERISKELDIADPIPHSYILEVSSPGLDKPLKKKRDFERHIGEKVNVYFLEPFEGKKNIEGVIYGTDEEDVLLQVGENIKTIPLSKIQKALLIVEF